ncbi:aldehyde-activating protein, partial [Leucothrix pacifica]
MPATGGCICGGVRYQVSDRSRLRQVVACHCDQCRRFSG